MQVKKFSFFFLKSFFKEEKRKNLEEKKNGELEYWRSRRTRACEVYPDLCIKADEMGRV